MRNGVEPSTSQKRECVLSILQGGVNITERNVTEVRQPEVEFEVNFEG